VSDRGAPPRSGAILTIAILAGVCSGVASTIALRLVSSEPAKSDAPEVDRAAASDSAALAALQQEVAALRQQIDQLRLPAPADASGAATPSALGPGAPATQAEVASIAEAVKQLEQRLQAALPPHIPPPGAEDATKREVLRPYIEKKKDLPTESYLYLTEAELLAAYGTPNAITTLANGHTAWLYVVDFGDASKPTRAFKFEFTGGRVTDYTRQ
jgi:hypothetical protein